MRTKGTDASPCRRLGANNSHFGPAPPAGEKCRLVVCADNDLNEHSRPNAGVDAARRAAEAVGGWVAVPELDGRPCDFNDLCWARGPEAVKEALRAAQAVANGKAQSDSGSEQAFDREVERLAELHPRRYERERADAAKQLKVRAAVLDKLVRAVQGKIEPAGMGTEITFDEPAPSPQAVDGADPVAAWAREDVPGGGRCDGPLGGPHPCPRAGAYLAHPLHLLAREAVRKEHPACGAERLGAPSSAGLEYQCQRDL